MKIIGFIYNNVVHLRLRDAISAVPDEVLNVDTKQFLIKRYFFSSNKTVHMKSLGAGERSLIPAYIKPISIRLKPDMVRRLAKGDYYVVDNVVWIGDKRFKELELIQ